MNDISKGSSGMRRFSTWLSCAAVAAAALGASASPASAMRGFAPSFRAPMQPMLAPVDRGIASDVVRTHGDVRDLGRLRTNVPVRIGVMLKLRNQAELERLTLLQGDRRSRYYHHYLSNQQWNDYFAPTEATYRRTELALARAGFRIVQTFTNRGMIRATGSAAVAERYFRTTLHAVSQTGRGERYVNVTPGVIPLELRDSVMSIVGLHSTVGKHFPLRYARGSHARRGTDPRLHATLANAARPRPMVTAAATPKPITTSTPAPNPSPDPTESSSNPLQTYAFKLDLGYGPPTFALAYDFPVQHGYGGTGRSAGSVIDSDFSDSDSALEYTTFDIPRTTVSSGGLSASPPQNTFRVCTDPSNICTICDDTNATTTAATCDPEGESTLDAQTIMSLAPKAAFYEYLVNSTYSLDDVDVDAAYERVVSDNVVDAVNSSFGECETDDPSALYDENIIAMEGAAKGIMFSASSGDTGATSCGTYLENGAPQTAVNVSEPASAPYFVAVGGTSFEMLTSCGSGDAGANCYTEEIGWMDGGGGVSVLEPQPSWQTALVAAGTTTGATPASGRDVPDLAFTADPETGVGEAVAIDGTVEGVGGTSLSSPMWVAMQTEIDQVQNSRNGLVTPRLYAIASASSAEYSFAYRDILAGDNVPYSGGTGYDLITGIGSVLGWELAGTE